MNGNRLRMLPLLFLWICALALAQSPTGTVRGIVQDSTGARIASARIAIRLSTSSSPRNYASDDRGEFRIDDLAPGDYSISVAARGFANATANLSVEVSVTRDIEVTLKPLSVSQTIGVRSQGSSIAEQPIDLGSTVHQAIAMSEDLERLPLPARSFANVAYLVPGTERVEPSDPTKARITAVSTGGSSGLNNEFSVDGGDNSDDCIGGFLQNFSPDSIQEFAIRTAQEDADTGGTTAGSVIITTKSGTDELHGDAAFYERAGALNGRFPIENPAPNPKQAWLRSPRR